MLNIVDYANYLVCIVVDTMVSWGKGVDVWSVPDGPPYGIDHVDNHLPSRKNVFALRDCSESV